MTKVHILLIEDDPAVARSLQDGLEREGYSVVQAADRDEGIAKLQAEKPAVVLIDHELEGDDGVEVLKQIKKLDAGCEVVLLTPGGEVEVAIEVLRAGALDYLKKPIDIEQLSIALGRARERRNQVRTSGSGLPSLPSLRLCCCWCWAVRLR